MIQWLSLPPEHVHLDEDIQNDGIKAIMQSCAVPDKIINCFILRLFLADVPLQNMSLLNKYSDKEQRSSNMTMMVILI